MSGVEGEQGTHDIVGGGVGSGSPGLNDGGTSMGSGGLGLNGSGTSVVSGGHNLNDLGGCGARGIAVGAFGTRGG
jgi:hypothetical protein